MTREIRHTPGPWELELVKYDSHRRRNSGFIVYSKDWQICFTESDGYHDGEPDNEEANARLIAAAPDLLAACREALKSRDELPCHGDVSALLMDAIAKAEGTTL